MNKSLLTILVLSANLFLIGCADEQARAQIADTNAKLAQMQKQMSAVLSAGNIQIQTLNRLDDLQSQIGQINGNIDTINHNLKSAQDTQNQINQSVEQQIQALQQGNASAPVAQVKAVASGVAADTSDLDNAIKSMKSRDYPNAIKLLKNIIKTNKDNNTVASAEYYLAVAYAASRQFVNAVASSRKFIHDNPNNNFVPDAMQVEYVSQLELGMKQSALKVANLLKKEYPNSEANKRVQATLGR